MKNVKLFCIPYAGGSALSYKVWKKHLNSNIELFPMELAGRGNRLNEPYYASMEEAVDDLYGTISNDIKCCSDYILFGHSMGSVIAYELYYKLIGNGLQKPLHIFFSGHEAPTRDIKVDDTYNLPADEFKQKLLTIGSSLAEIIDNEEYMGFFLPIIRADYRILGQHAYQLKDIPMDCDITILNGRDDIKASQHDLEGWTETTKGKCNFLFFDGGHFYINQYMREVVNIINSTVTGSSEIYSK